MNPKSASGFSSSVAGISEPKLRDEPREGHFHGCLDHSPSLDLRAHFKSNAACLFESGSE
jgi:hypothetical protein